MDLPSFVLRLTRAIPRIGAQAGDRLIVRVGHPEAVVLHRVLPPNYGLVLDAIDGGELEMISPQLEACELIDRLRAVGDELPQLPGRPSRAPRGNWRLRLHRPK